MLIKEQLPANESTAQRSRSWLTTLSRRARLSGSAVDAVIVGAKNEFAAAADHFRYVRVGLLVAIPGLGFLPMAGIYPPKGAQTQALLAGTEETQPRHTPR